MNIVVLKTAHHLHDGIHFATVRKELVAQTFALRRAFDEAGDIHELDDRRDQLVRTADLGEHGKALVRHGDHPHIRLYRAERKICRLCFGV